jgi:hypothetical protein
VLVGPAVGPGKLNSNKNEFHGSVECASVTHRVCARACPPARLPTFLHACMPAPARPPARLKSLNRHPHTHYRRHTRACTSERLGLNAPVLPEAKPFHC